MANSKMSHLTIDGTTYNLTGSLPMGTVDSTSTATAFTVQIPGVTEYFDGLTIYVFNNKIATASGITLNVNSLGAKKIYRANANAEVTTHWAVNTGYLLTYNAARNSNAGGWDWQTGYDSNSDSTCAGNIRNTYSTFAASGAIYDYMLCFQSSETQVIPANVVDGSVATTKTLNTASFLPYGVIGWYNTTTTIASGSAIPASNFWLGYSLIDLRYSFNTGTTLTANKDVYIQCSPQTDGKLKFSGNSCITQTLPTTADGYVYILLGHTYDTYRIALYYYHPIFIYANSKLRLWSGYADYAATAGTASSATTATNIAAFSLTGDVTASANNAHTYATTLTTSGVTAGSYGSSSGATLAYSGKFTVPYITFDAKGRATAASSKTFTLPAAPTSVDSATTATNLSSMSLTGDVTGSGTNTNTLATTLTASGVTAGSYGPASGSTLSHSGKFTVPYITFDSKGRATSASSITYTLPGSGNSDKNVQQNAAITTAGEYPVLLAATTATSLVTSTVNKTSTLKYNPSTGVLTATSFSGSMAWSNISSPPSSYTPSSHTHGNITNAGVVTATVTVASGDRLLLTDSSDSSKVVASGISFGTATTTYLRNDGTWGTPAGGTDVNVQQNAAITTAGEYPLILANSTATTTVTGVVNKTSTLKYNPNTQVLTSPKIAATTMTGILTCQNNTSYGTKQARNIFIISSSSSLPTGANGDVCLIY